MLLLTTVALCFLSIASSAPAADADLPAFLGPLANQHFDALSQAAKQNAVNQLNQKHVNAQSMASIDFDNQGRLIYVDQHLPNPPADDHAANNDDARGVERRAISDQKPTNFNSQGLPLLSSNPSSSYKIFLDFDGMTVQGSNNFWIESFQPSGGKFRAKAFSLDNNYQDFNSNEVDVILDIWGRIVEDYAPWDVDVTTIKPTTSNMIHCLITESYDKDGRELPYGASAGGVAYLDVWGYSDARPAFVYYDNLYSVSSWIAEAASHELGHNFGLNHDGTSNLEYFGGDDDRSNPISWGPIMGTGYDNHLSQWSNGNYNKANNGENDIAIISRSIPHRPDEAGDSIGSAKILNNNNGVFKTSGIIGTGGDVDFYSFDLSAPSPVSITASTWRSARSSDTGGSNLDIVMKLRNAQGTVVTTAKPNNNMNANIQETLAGGSYFVELRGGLDPNSIAKSNYGSMGQYDLVIETEDDGGDGGSCTCPNGNWASSTKKSKKYVITMGVNCGNGHTITTCLTRNWKKQSRLFAKVQRKTSSGWKNLSNSPDVAQGKGSSICYQHTLKGWQAKKGKKFRIVVKNNGSTQYSVTRGPNKVTSCVN